MATPFTEPETQPTSTVLQLLGVVSADDEMLLELTETGIRYPGYRFSSTSG
jgi:hypothetical protein